MLFSRFYGGWAKYQKLEKQETMLSFKEGNKKGTSSASWISIPTKKKGGKKKFGNAVCKCLGNNMQWSEQQNSVWHECWGQT